MLYISEGYASNDGACTDVLGTVISARDVPRRHRKPHPVISWELDVAACALLFVSGHEIFRRSHRKGA